MLRGYHLHIHGDTKDSDSQLLGSVMEGKICVMGILIVYSEGTKQNAVVFKYIE